MDKKPSPASSSADIPLPPLLSSAPAGENVTIVSVLPRPQFGGARGMTPWTVNEEPAIRFAKGSHIVLRTDTEMFGLGTLSQAADVR